jgi:hypothetical protein
MLKINLKYNKKMFKFIINVYALILLFKITIEQIHLAKSNLDLVCNCK